MEYDDKIIILRVEKFREIDLRVRFLSSQTGIGTAFAFGGCRSHRRFAGCLDNLNEVKVHIKKSGQGKYLNLEEGTLLCGPRRLRHDWKRLGQMANCLKFVEALGIHEEDAEKAYSLVQKLFATFEDSPALSPHLPLFFRLRLAADQGYTPFLDACQKCGKTFQQDTVLFQALSGGIRCPECRDEHHVLKLQASSIKYLDCIKKMDPVDWPIEFATSIEKEQCMNMIEVFIQYHVGLIWHNGFFKRV